jgi:hypothetical protein
MAYVVARPGGRFEIRESVHTPKGPRARSLANFERLTDEVLETARRRASRPFDAEAVRASARKASKSAAARPRPGQGRLGGVATPTRLRHEQPLTRQFVEASRRMARALEQTSEPAARQDPGDALIDLLGFVAQIRPYRPAGGEPEPLRFPPLARLRAQTAARARPSNSGR